MKLLLIADGRSPITQRWIKAIAPFGARIMLVSTFPCAPIPDAELVAVLPVAFARQAGSQAGSGKGNLLKMNLVSALRPLLAKVRHQLGPYTLGSFQKQLLELIQTLQPDVVHALRIPYEGMLASITPTRIPLIVSTWGNDLTLHATANTLMGRLTRQTLLRADGLLSDTAIDVTRAAEWGFDTSKPSLVVVGNGGLDLEEMQEAVKAVKPTAVSQIINPRGIRSYVRTDTFFQAIPLVLKRHPQVQFVCTSMANQKEALDWVEKLGIKANVRLLGYLSQHKLWKETARSLASVSVSTHDGTPNTLLEAMALGCLPICGDLPSIREWITPGENGLLVPANDPSSLADAICRAIEDAALRKTAAGLNKTKIGESASVASTRSKIAEFYTQFLLHAPRE